MPSEMRWRSVFNPQMVSGGVGVPSEPLEPATIIREDEATVRGGEVVGETERFRGPIRATAFALRTRLKQSV